MNNKLIITRKFTDVLKGNLKKNLSRLSPMISSLGQKWTMEVVRQYGFKLVSLSLYSVTSKIHARVKLFHNFGQYLFIMSKRHGVPYTVKYLKACQLAVQKRVAGQPLTSLRELEPDLALPRLTKSGLPRFIQLRDRRAIISGSHSVIRMWLSFFAIYRVIKIPVVAKLATITNPFSGSTDYLRELEQLIPSGIGVFQGFFDKKFNPKNGWKSTNGILPIMKAGGGFNVSVAKLLVLPKALASANLWTTICNFVALSGNTVLGEQLQKIEYLSKRAYELLGNDISSTPVGKLAFKEEAAGKLRTFAIVDCITQSALFGLHEWLFELLRRIPNDGTFDQEAAFSRAQAKASKAGCSFGYDLSAATDRLPLSLQVKILESWFGAEVAEMWRVILVERDYMVAPGKKADKYGIKPGPYRYSVGQPMGAYSSWAMLAITHHFIVQWAYFSVYFWPFGQKWFEGYELLGDDIVIFDADVAAKYLEIMQGLGVEINLSKSVVSNPGSVVEFAKRTSFKGVDVSAISLKMLQAAKDFKSKTQVALYLGLKTGRQIGNYVKAMFALGPSQLYKMDSVTLSQKRAEASILMQMMKPDWSNFPTLMKASIDTTDDSWEEMFYFGKHLTIPHQTAHKLVCALVKGENVDLRSTGTQQAYYWDMERVLRPLLVEKACKMMKSVYHKFFYGSNIPVQLILAPWLEFDMQNGSSTFVPFEKSDREGGTPMFDALSNMEDGRYDERFMDFQSKLYRFVWDAWFYPHLDKVYIEILDILGARNLEIERLPGDLHSFYDRFNGAAADSYYYAELPLEKVFLILSKLESLMSIETRFKYGWDKLRGVETPVPELDPSKFAVKLLNEISVMLAKANREGKVGYLDSLNNRF